jgi:hypothetical protein
MQKMRMRAEGQVMLHYMVTRNGGLEEGSRTRWCMLTCP